MRRWPERRMAVPDEPPDHPFLFGFMVGFCVCAGIVGITIAAATAHAQDDEVQAWADRIQVSRVELEGALDSVQAAYPNVTLEDYMVSEGHASRGTAALYVRLTHYVEAGVTYGGGYTYAGSAACSWNLPLGTRLRFPDGEIFMCNDRGLLGSTGWVDLWRRPDIVRKYGSHTVVEILP